VTSTKTPDEVQVIEPPRPGRRRRYTAQEKLAFLQEAEGPGGSMSLVARRYGISPSQLFRWRRYRDEGTLTSLGAGEAVVPESELKALESQVRELQRLLGKKTLENEILKEALEIARSKKLLSRKLLPDKDGSR
jgi:transposase